MEYFAAIARHGQFQRAAAALNLSQPALSKSVQRLEQGIKARLLKRTPKGVELTAVGAALLRQIEPLRLHLDDIARETLDLSEGRVGEIRVGSGPDLADDLLPVAYSAFRREAPRAKLKVIVGTADVSLPALTCGELDLVVTASSPGSHGDLAREQLLGEEYLVYSSASHKLASKNHVSLADVAAEEWVLAVTNEPVQRRDFHRIFDAAGLPLPKVAVETNSVPFRLQLLRSTDLLGFLPKRVFHGSLASGQLAELRVKGLSYRRTIAVYYRKAVYLSPTIKRFIGILKKVAMTARYARNGFDSIESA